MSQSAFMFNPDPVAGGLMSCNQSDDARWRGQRPDIAFLVFDQRGSGVVRNLHSLMAATRGAGYCSTLVRVGNTVELAAENGQDQGPSHKLASLPETFGRPLAIASAVPALRYWLKTVRPRLLFAAGSHIHPLVIAAQAGLSERPRLLLRISNDIQHSRPGWLLEPASIAIARLVRPLISSVVCAADAAVCVSTELRDQIARNTAVDPSRLHAIPNGVDGAFARQKASEPLDDPWFEPDAPELVLGIGRLVTQKNFPLLIEAVAKVNQVRPVRLMILGSGSDQARRRLMALADRRGLVDRFRLPGFDGNPFRYLARAAVFAQSSSWEGMPNTVLEALAVGCPVVATRCRTGITELLQGSGEFMTRPGDVDALAEALLKRLQMPRDSARLVSHADQFDRATMTRRYLEVIDHLLGKPRSICNRKQP